MVWVVGKSSNPKDVLRRISEDVLCFVCCEVFIFAYKSVSLTRILANVGIVISIDGVVRFLYDINSDDSNH